MARRSMSSAGTCPASMARSRSDSGAKGLGPPAARAAHLSSSVAVLAGASPGVRLHMTQRGPFPYRSRTVPPQCPHLLAIGKQPRKRQGPLHVHTARHHALECRGPPRKVQRVLVESERYGGFQLCRELMGKDARQGLNRSHVPSAQRFPLCRSVTVKE